ncbi:phage tail tip protein J-related protein [Salinicola lusitanus]|uniref:phage tail tip protein J-related protein n=1 Tax=Salinicola lusitanus TaxID=1949085 RepID=UPI000DA1C4BA|nr:hypothetical protein [Salinicola lusitanus]
MSKAVDAVSKVFSAVFKPISKILAPGIDKPKAASDTGNTKQTIRSGKEPAHFIYGRTATGGLLFWAQEEPGDGAKREKLHLAYLLAEGEIDSLEQIYVNQQPVSEYGDLADWELHVNRSTPDPFMLANCPDWKESQVGRGVSWVRGTLTFDKDKFATGIPDLLFVVRGNRNIYDPRTGQTGYSDNAVLCTLDYVRNRLGVADQFIVWDAWSAAANIADESVADPDGVFRKRYAIGGVYKADQRKDETLASLEENFGGTTRRVGGYWGVEVGAYYGPAVATITQGMVVGSITGRPEVSRRDAINSVAGKWNSPTDLWEETSYPTVTVDEWVAEDGGENTDTLDTPFSPSTHQSQRLANIKLRRQRAGGQLEIPLNYAGYQFRPGRVINVDLPTINVSGEFKVLEWRFSAKEGVRVVVRQELPEFYDDAVGEPFDYLSIIQTPTGGIGSPTNLRYTVETIGEVVQGRMTWDPVNAAIDYNVVVLLGTEVIQAAKTPSGATTCTLSGLGAGDYTANVTARGLQSTSGPATIAFSVLNPPQPARVITQVDRTNVLLVPVLADGDSLGGGTWEYRWGVTEVFGDAEYLGRGDTITHTGRSPGQELYYWVRGINAYGASDWFAVSVTTSENFDDVISAVNDDIYRPGGLADQFQNGLDENYEAIQDAQAAFDEALNQADSRIDQANTDIATLREQVDGLDPEEQGVRIAKLERKTEELDKLQAVRYLALQARNAGAAALIDVVQTTQVTDKQALTQLITQQTSRINDAVAELLEINTTLATLDESTTERIEQAQSSIAANVAALEEISTTIANQESAAVFRKLALQAQALGNTAQQDVDRIVSADGRSALSQRLETLSADYQGNKSSVSSTLTALSQKDAALAQSLEKYRVESGNQIGEVSQQLSAAIDPKTGVVTRAVTTVNANGRLGMLGIQVDGKLAEIIGIADQFAILNPVSGELVTAFVVTDGRVIIPEALIDSLVVTKLRSTNGNLVFDGDKLKADYIDANSLKVKWANVQDIIIKWADIQDVKIKSTDIEDASIGTLKLADQAVTINASAFSGSTVELDTGWKTVAQVEMDPQGQPIDIVLSFSYEVNAQLQQGVDYSRYSIYGRIVAGGFTYDFESSYGYLVDERQYEEGTFRRRSMVTVPRRSAGWSGNRTVSMQLKGDSSGSTIPSGILSTWQHYIKLSVTKR